MTSASTVARSMLTTAEVATVLGVMTRTVNQYIRRGQLKAEKRGRDLFISQQELERFQRERPVQGWPKGKPRKGSRRDQA
jgi:excisionase family DNA binding protein